jgi:uncharacterized Fe-S center protein
MCDGVRGSDQFAVDLSDTKHIEKAYLGSGVAVMDGLVAVSHPTGHPGAGFAAAIKNISMGLSSRGGKMAMHHGSFPDFVSEKCIGCGRCATWCPADAIVVEETARLIEAQCIGCGECLAVCPADAIDFQWSQKGIGFQERLVEYCAAVKALLKERILYVNVLQHVQASCDCLGRAMEAVCPDVGIVASRDLVAVDTASADLLQRATARDVAHEVGNRDYREMLAYGETMGLGSTDYELVES